MPDFNHVTLNLPAYSSAKPPIEDEPAMKINGVAVESVTELAIVAGCNGYTTVTVTFYATVGGIVCTKKED